MTDLPTAGVDRIRVLIADDHALFRRGLSWCSRPSPTSRSWPRPQTATRRSTAGRGARARRRPHGRAHAPASTASRPPGRSEEPVPAAKILMLTVSDEEEDLYEAIKAGANGYLLKEISIEEVAEAIRAVVAGPEPDLAVDGVQAADRVQQLAKQAEERQPSRPPAHRAGSSRCSSWWPRGMSNREIAEELFIAENTVKNHVRNILEKLQLHSRMEAVVYAVREKVLDIN